MSKASEARPRLGRSSLALVLLAGIVGTIQYHSAQFLSGFDHVFGDRGDARGFLYYCEHWYHFLSGKASLLSPAVFYPTKGTLAYSDLLLGVGVPYSLFRVLGFDMFISLELVIILIVFLSYCTAFWLLYKVLGFRLAASIVGAMFFAFNSPKFFQLIHLQLQYVVLLPLIFGLLITFGKQVQILDQKRAAILLSLAVLCWDLQMATAFYFAWFFVLWFVFFLLLSLAFTRTRRFIVAVCKKFWRAILVAAAVLLVGFIPMLLLYLPLAKGENWYVYDIIVVHLIPEWRALLWTGLGNYLWGGITSALTSDPRPFGWGELQIGIGLISSLMWIVLTVATIWFIRVRRQDNSSIDAGSSIPNPGQLGMLFLAILILSTNLFYVIGFRYGNHSPWYYIYKYFPAGGAIRAVSRYVIFLALPMAIAFGYLLDRGLAYAARERSQIRRRALTAVMLVLGGLIAFEQFGVTKMAGDGFSATLEKAYLNTQAAKLSPDCEAFYLVAGPPARRNLPDYQYDAMLISLISGIPTLNASSSLFPPGWQLYEIKNPDYEEKVKSWVALQNIKGKVCRLETGPEFDAFDPKYPGPIRDQPFFVRQLYRDFTGEEPKAETANPQIEKLACCRKEFDEATCSTQIAFNIFLTTGFHERGSFILRMYQAGLGRLPTFEEFTNEMARFKDYLAAGPPEVAKKRMVEEFMASNAQHLMSNEKPLQELVDSDELVRRLSNRNFVALHYYGFLQREPDEGGLASWTRLLDRRGDPALITTGVITSVEYRNRLEIHKFSNPALNSSYERLSDPFGLVPRKNIVSAKSSHFGAPLFNG
jgi:hypothetical protein